MPTLETLRGLQHAHFLSVPFENLDIHRGRRITLDEAALFEKIVTRQQGGFCFELNGLFAELLRAVGFEVRMMSARMNLGNGQFGMPFDHLALMVQLEERWLADVTLPSDFREPLRLDQRGRQDGIYRIDYDGENYLYRRLSPEGEWTDRYMFTETPRKLSDFDGMCHYHQTSPDTWFTQRRMVTRGTREGWVTLTESRLIITRAGRRHETPINSEEAFRSALLEHFGLVF
jgi:N-hydroxyarylamine O-acetyltransferase